MKLYTMIPQQDKQNIDFPCVPFCIEQLRVYTADTPHIHDFQQLTIIVGGQSTLSVNGVSYPVRAGNAYVIGSYIPHSLRQPRDLEIVNILFRTEELLRYAGSLKDQPGFQALFMLPGGSDAAGAGFGHLLTMDFENHNHVRQIIRTILAEVQRGAGGSEVLVQSYFMILVTMFSRMYEANTPYVPEENELCQLLSFITQNYARPLRMTEIARAALLSERKARDLFAQEFHCSPMQYLTALRLKHACYLLKTTGLSVSEIAARTGFEDNNYFSRCFRQHLHCTPSVFRAQQDTPDEADLLAAVSGRGLQEE